MSTHPARADRVEGDALDTAMAGFRDRARATNLTRVAVIVEALQAMHDGPLPEDVRLTARAAAHSLVGSAGTFGFDRASELARDLESLLDDVRGAEDAQVRAGRGLEQAAWLREALADPAAAPSPPTGGREDSREEGT